MWSRSRRLSDACLQPQPGVCDCFLRALHQGKPGDENKHVSIVKLLLWKSAIFYHKVRHNNDECVNIKKIAKKVMYHYLGRSEGGGW